MSALDPAVKNVIFIVLLVAMSFVFFIIVLVMTYKKRQRTLVVESKLKEAEIERVKLESQIATLKAINEEKERISADIHDDMGGNVSSINFLSKLIKVEGVDEKSIKFLKEMQSQSFELSQKMKDIVWATKSENDNLENLIQYIQHFAIKQLEPLGFIVTFDKPEVINNIFLKGELRKDIFMTVKESINNIIKHSGADKVEISIQNKQSDLFIRIHDNGKGLTNDVQGGNGLKQMLQRMQRHHGSFVCKNDNGLIVSLQVDLVETYSKV